MNPQLLERIDREIVKSENNLENMEVEERKHTIIEQLGRITFLEDRLELLMKETSNQVFHSKFKTKKVANMRNDHDKLLGETSNRPAEDNDLL